MLPRRADLPDLPQGYDPADEDGDLTITPSAAAVVLVFRQIDDQLDD